MTSRTRGRVPTQRWPRTPGHLPAPGSVSGWAPLATRARLHPPFYQPGHVSKKILPTMARHLSLVLRPKSLVWSRDMVPTLVSTRAAAIVGPNSSEPGSASLENPEGHRCAQAGAPREPGTANRPTCTKAKFRCFQRTQAINMRDRAEPRSKSALRF
jgi:hypothetical protein